MDIFNTAVVVGAFYIGYYFGKEQGVNEHIAKELKELNEAFPKFGYFPETPKFFKAFRMQGMQYDDDRVIIQVSDLEHLLAIQ